jgi:hypothetical protein
MLKYDLYDETTMRSAPNTTSLRFISAHYSQWLQLFQDEQYPLNQNYTDWPSEMLGCQLLPLWKCHTSRAVVLATFFFSPNKNLSHLRNLKTEKHYYCMTVHSRLISEHPKSNSLKFSTLKLFLSSLMIMPTGTPSLKINVYKNYMQHFTENN